MNKTVLSLAGLGLLLSACGTATSDLSLYLSNPRVVTEYYTVDGSGARVPVACDKLDGQAPLSTIRLYFGFSGSLKSVNMQLRGVTTGQYDSNFNRTFSGSEISRDDIQDDLYYVSFQTDATRPTPLSGGGSVLQAQGITPTPTASFTRRQVRPQGSASGAFFARSFATSASDQQTATVDSSRVNVYSNCATVQ